MTTVQTKKTRDRKKKPSTETIKPGAKHVLKAVVSENGNWQSNQEDELKSENHQDPESPTELIRVEELFEGSGIRAAKPRRERRSAIAALEWARYRRTKAPEARQNLLNIYLPLVRSVAGRMALRAGFDADACFNDINLRIYLRSW